MPINKPTQVTGFTSQWRYFHNLNSGKKHDCLNSIQIIQAFNAIQPVKGNNNKFI
jgi:hypothetical protein